MPTSADTQARQHESTQRGAIRPSSPAEALYSHLAEAWETTTDALAFLHVVELAMTDRELSAQSSASVCTVLEATVGLIERARDAAEWARKGGPHG